MGSLIIAALFFLLTTHPAYAQERVGFAEGRVSFVPPPGFTALTQEEIDRKFPRGNRPASVYGNDRRTVTVAITLSQAKLRPEELPEFKKFFETLTERTTPGLKWITRDFVVINNVKWIRLEFTHHAVDTDIHSDMYITSFDGRMLGFNFNAVVGLLNEMRPQLLKSRDSIAVKSGS